MSVLQRLQRNGPVLTPEFRNQGESEGGVPEIAIGTVMAEEDDEIWARVEGRKAYVEVRLESGGSSGCFTIAEAPVSVLGQLGIGSVVVLNMVNGDPSHAYIIGLVHVLDDGIPDAVAGIETGAAAAADIDVDDPPIAPLPLFLWTKTDAGRHVAVETGAGADFVVHASASAELKAGAAIHMPSVVHVGQALATRPVARLAGAPVLDDGEVAGAPGTPHQPPPYTHATTPAYTGWADAAVRAKDAYQSTAAVSPAFWNWFAAWKVYQAATAVYLDALASLNPVLIGPATTAFEAATQAFNAVPDPTEIISRALTASGTLTAADAPPG